MATEGLDPYRKLAELFWGPNELTPERMAVAQQAIGNACYGRGAFKRFRWHMEEAKTGHTLTTAEGDLAQGLLECVNPYQSYEPHTRPEFLVRTGIYDHFKGGIYLLKGFSKWASGDGERVVEYLSMLHGTSFTRLASQWCEVVMWPDGKYRSRFVFRGADLGVPPPPFKVPSPV